MIRSAACIACVGVVLAPAVNVRAPLVLGFTDMHGERIESVSLVEGRPFTVDGGGGRYARAAGKLHFAGALDADSVPGVVVLPGKLTGKLRMRPAPPKPAFTKPVSIDRRGKGAKLRFRQITTDPFFAKLTSGFATALSRFGNGVFIETDDVRADTRLRPKVVTWFGADGTWSAKGTTNLDTGPDGSDPLKITGGTGRYSGAHGRVGYTLLTDPATSGVQVARLRGKLRFP